ncbi:MAG: hypothetical protein E6I26_13550 [Chloroflexi bacterium]|nr:MAG: hypothetical protein E6I26_13550 [Chloroflexota bacterium]
MAIFGARADVSAIVHTHSPFAMAWSAARRQIPAAHYVIAPLVAAGGDAIRVAEYATFGTEALAKNAVAALGDDSAVLLANHGAVAVARSLASAFGRAERIEELAAIAWRAEQLGGPVLLDATELDRVGDQMARFPPQRGTMGS